MTPNEFLLNREALNLTPPQLAKELRVSTRHIDYIEKGERKPSGVLIGYFELLIEKEVEKKNIAFILKGFKHELKETEETMARILKLGDWAPNTLIMSAKLLINILETKARTNK